MLWSGARNSEEADCCCCCWERMAVVDTFVDRIRYEFVEFVVGVREAEQGHVVSKR